jgi:hypothetical protein
MLSKHWIYLRDYKVAFETPWLHNAVLCFYTAENVIYPFKYEAQTALFKEPIRTAQ